MGEESDLPPKAIVNLSSSKAINGNLHYKAKNNSHLSELIWAILVSALPFIADFIFRVSNRSDASYVSFSSIAYSLFALSATGFARSIQNGRNLNFLAILFLALAVQMLLAVLSTDSGQGVQIIQWSILSVSGLLTILGILLSWWPDKNDVIEQVRQVENR